MHNCNSIRNDNPNANPNLFSSSTSTFIQCAPSIRSIRNKSNLTSLPSITPIFVDISRSVELQLSL